MHKPVIIITALGLVAALIWLPTPEGLSPLGQVLLAITGGMLLLWLTQAVDFSASSFYLMGLMALCCGLTQDPDAPGQAIGAIKGVRLAMQGFSSPAWILVGCALFIAATVDSSGLGQRLSLRLISVAGTSPRRIIVAVFALELLLCLIIPSPAANVSLSVVLVLSVVRFLRIPLTSNLSKNLFLIVAFVPQLATIMILTNGGGPIQIASYIYQGTGYDISWLEFFIYGAPLGFGLCLAMYGLLCLLFPAGNEPLANGQKLLREAMSACGPFSRREKGVTALLCVIIPLWATSKVLHPVGTSTIALLAVAAIFCPGLIGSAKEGLEGPPLWKDIAGKVSWGTMCLFGAVLSLGQGLLDSGGASWLARSTLVRMGLAELPLLVIIVGGGAVFALFGVAFSARAAAIAALTPTIIGFAQSLPPENQVPAWGLTLVINYAIQFALIVPTNSPTLMISMHTGAFTARDLLRLSIPLALAGFVLLFLLSCTWWPWLGVL